MFADGNDRNKEPVRMDSEDAAGVRLDSNQLAISYVSNSIERKRNGLRG